LPLVSIVVDPIIGARAHFHSLLTRAREAAQTQAVRDDEEAGGGPATGTQEEESGQAMTVKRRHSGLSSMLWQLSPVSQAMARAQVFPLPPRSPASRVRAARP